MGPGTAPADRGPTLRAPSGEIHATEPPPAPTVTTSIMGIRLGYAPTLPSVVSVGSPSRTTLTSVLVPPPSRVRTLGTRALRASRPAPRAPAAGPLRTVVMGRRAPSVADATPPLLFMTANVGSPSLRNRSAMAAT